MALRTTYQQTISLSTLYEIRRSAPVSGAEQIAPSIEVVGGTVSIYGAQNFTTPGSPPTGMYLTRSGFSGIETFAVLPNYLYVTGSGTVTLSGVSAVVAS